MIPVTINGYHVICKLMIIEETLNISKFHYPVATARLTTYASSTLNLVEEDLDSNHCAKRFALAYFDKFRVRPKLHEPNCISRKTDKHMISGFSQ